MTYFFTPLLVLAQYKTSLGHRYDVDEEQVLMGDNVIAEASSYPFALRNTTGNNGPCAGVYNDEDVQAILTQQLDTLRYPAGWDKSSGFWWEAVRGKVPTLYGALQSNIIPLIFDTDSCKKIVQEFIPVMALNPSVGCDVMFEVFSSAAINGGIVYYS